MVKEKNVAPVIQRDLLRLNLLTFYEEDILPFGSRFPFPPMMYR
jgi:hypothetical protein